MGIISDIVNGGVNERNLVDYILDYESGDLSDVKTIELFSYLVKSGKAWSLQGHYGRTAQQLIKAGILDKDGRILRRRG